MPAAPAAMQSRPFSTFTPPIAITGTRESLQIWRSRSRPCGGPKLRFEGVSNIGPIEHIARSSIFGHARFGFAVAGDSHQKIRLRGFAPRPAEDFAAGQRRLAQVYSVRASGDGYVQAIIYDYARRSIVGAFPRRPGIQSIRRERQQIRSGQVFLAKLNPVHAGSGGQMNRIAEFRSGISRAERTAVGDIADDGSFRCGQQREWSAGGRLERRTARS